MSPAGSECDAGGASTSPRQSRHIDQIDADLEAIRWIEERAVALGADRIEWHNHEYPGRTGSVWRGNTLLAVTVVLRDLLNWSVLVRHDLGAVAHDGPVHAAVTNR